MYERIFHAGEITWYGVQVSKYADYPDIMGYQRREQTMCMNHINIVVNNMKENEDFFALFGYIRNREMTVSGKWLETMTLLTGAEADYLSLSHPDSPVRIELLKYITPPSPASRCDTAMNLLGFRHLALDVPSMEEMRKKVEDAGYSFTSETQVNTYGRETSYCIGPEGIIVELLCDA